MVVELEIADRIHDPDGHSLAGPPDHAAVAPAVGRPKSLHLGQDPGYEGALRPVLWMQYIHPEKWRNANLRVAALRRQ